MSGVVGMLASKKDFAPAMPRTSRRTSWRERILFIMATARTSLLDGLLHTQDSNNSAVTQLALRQHARQVAAWARGFDAPVLLAVDATAQRLLGAVSLLVTDEFEIPVFAQRLDQRTVLLVASIAASTIELEAAATHARRRGAHSVHGCAIHIDSPATASGLDSLTLLGRVAESRRATA